MTAVAQRGCVTAHELAPGGAVGRHRSAAGDDQDCEGAIGRYRSDTADDPTSLCAAGRHRPGTGDDQDCEGAEPARRPHEVVAGVASGLPPVGLAEVLSVAGLQTRVDRKYLLTPEQFVAMVRGVRNRFQVLETGGLRLFGYESVYFDTPALDLYRDHRQGRRRRYKVRSRTYLDSGECMFEVKLKGYRGQTCKHRLAYDLGDRGVISQEARSFLSHVLTREYGVGCPPLEPVMTTAYRRTTLVDLQDGARLTCDVDLECSNSQRLVRGTDLVLVESKSAGGRAVADQTLAAMGVRPVSISKYCIGIAQLHPHLPANRWSRLLRQEFGWVRDLTPGPPD